MLLVLAKSYTVHSIFLCICCFNFVNSRHYRVSEWKRMKNLLTEK